MRIANNSTFKRFQTIELEKNFIQKMIEWGKIERDCRYIIRERKNNGKNRFTHSYKNV